MVKSVRVVVDRRAIVALLRSDDTARMLDSLADEVATNAGPGMEVETSTGRNRARAAVFTATRQAQKAEATSRRLSIAAVSGVRDG